jgi:hypothetical protein
MAYAAVPRRRRHGLFGYSDLPGNSDTVPSAQDYKKQADAAVSSAVDQAKAQAIAYAKQQLENYPPAAAVIAEYNKYAAYFKGIPGFKVSDLKDPKKVEALMQKALIAYARDNGVPTNQKELEQYAMKVAASDLGVQIPTDWPTNVKDLKAAAVNLATTAFVMETGLDSSILTVTAESLMDGKLSPSECEAIGGVAGAIAGAVVCQAFGIPAPIGAFIGGLIGKDIGGTIGQIFGAGPSGAEEIQSRINAQSSWAKSTVAEANALCSTARASYWQTFDQLLLSTELQWELAEINIGWKFNLRWFGVETYAPIGQPFSHAWDAPTRRFTGAETQANRAQVVGHQVQASTYYDAAQGKDVTARSNVYSYGCPVDFGCPYPIVSGLTMPTGLERDAQAFLARGAIWLPEAERHYQCSYPVPSGVDLLDSTTRQNWLNSMASALAQEQAAVKALQILSVTVVGDLVKTAATVGAEKKINDILKANAQQLTNAALDRAAGYVVAQKTGKNLSDLLNYGMLLLGVGLLGATLWKKRKS